MKTVEQTNTETVTSFIEAFWNQNDWNSTDHFLSPDYQEHAYHPPTIEGLKQAAKQSIEAFPDQNYSIQEVVAQGDKVIARIEFKGTHKGPFRGTPPTGNSIKVTVYREYRLVDGEIVEHQALFDTASLFRQIETQLTPENACKIK